MAVNGSFAGVAFKVVADNGHYRLPDGMPDDQGKRTVTLDLVFESRAAYNNLSAKGTRADWILPLGLTLALPSYQAGYGPAELVLPTHGGRQQTYAEAILERFAAGLGEASHAHDRWRATVTFAVVSRGAGTV